MVPCFGFSPAPVVGPDHSFAHRGDDGHIPFALTCRNLVDCPLELVRLSQAVVLIDFMGPFEFAAFN